MLSDASLIALRLNWPDLLGKVIRHYHQGFGSVRGLLRQKPIC